MYNRMTAMFLFQDKECGVKPPRIVSPHAELDAYVEGCIIFSHSAWWFPGGVPGVIMATNVFANIPP
ncbi:MAG: hypothetical protein NPIRA03_39710 [Nitrospirales bacterium]|nr:MAG: hypothetical protein NPIRA03_39710 [Nitrospirales bacterium]